MRILILSCNTGQGHNSAAHALKEALERHGDVCDIHNALLFLSPTKDKIICNGHVFVYRNLPRLFGLGYRYEEKHPPTFICKQLSHGIGKIHDFLLQNPYDAIICVHVFAAILVNEMKKETGMQIYTSFVSTDYTCCPGALQSEADTYFTPHPLLNDEFFRAGIAQDTVVPCGIPVSRVFLNRVPKTEARRVLGLPQDREIVLIGCGSMGAGSIEDLAIRLSEKLGDAAFIIVCCGSNQRMLSKMLRLEHSNILPLGYTRRMSLYMDAADLYLSKAGGLSTTEAVMKQLPLIYMNAVPGCETKNIEFMTRHGFAAASFSDEEALQLVDQVLKNPESARAKIAECRQALPADPADVICEYIRHHLEKTEVIS